MPQSSKVCSVPFPNTVTRCLLCNHYAHPTYTSFLHSGVHEAMSSFPIPPHPHPIHPPTPVSFSLSSGPLCQKTQSPSSRPPYSFAQIILPASTEPCENKYKQNGKRTGWLFSRRICRHNVRYEPLSIITGMTLISKTKTILRTQSLQPQILQVLLRRICSGTGL
jgi:hypothetical protein